MASVFFVGCTTPPTPDPDPDPTPTPVVVISSTPVLTAVESSVNVAIVDVTSTSTQYMNKAEAGSSILVKGTAPAESLVKIYLDDVAIATVAETAVTGLWTIAIAESALGDDGVKVLTAKVTEVGLAESAASNAATFTLDTVLPSATTLAATAETAAVTMRITSAITAGLCMVDSFVATGSTVSPIAAGTWTVESVGVSGATSNVKISNGTTTFLYTITDGDQILTNVIPGVRFHLNQSGTAAYTSVGNITTLTITNTALIPDRAKVGFSEEITSASAILLTNYTWTDAATAITTAATYTSKYAYFNTFATGGPLALNETLRCSVNGVVDLAGNIQTTASVLSCTVGAASATSLAP